MFAKLKLKYAGLHFRIPSKATIVQKSEHFLHMTYLGAVSVEAHGMYAHAAMMLLAVTVLGLFVHAAVEV